MRGGATGVALAVLVLVVGVGSALDAALPPPAPVSPPEAAVAATAGTWYCAAGATEAPDEVRVVSVTPPDAAASGDVRVDTFTGGRVTRGAEREVFAGGSSRVELPDGLATVGVAVRWWRAPAAVVRVWQRRTAGQPRGTVAGPCQSQPSPTWVIPGVSTAGGAEARLALANPFGTDASVGVSLLTPDGLVEPQLLANVVVPKGSVREIVLNDHLPERPDLAVVVATRSGRVVAEGYQTVSPAVGGVEGVSLARAAASAATAWTVPWFGSRGDEVASWLWIANAGEAPASLTLTVHTPGGGTVPADPAELTVPPGQVTRVDLSGVLPPDREHGAVTVRSENEPVVVSRATRVAQPGRTGLSVQLGLEGPDASWVLIGPPAEGRQTHLDIVNPGGEPARVDVALLTPEGVRTPPELAGIAVPVGALVTVDLGPHLPAGEVAAAFVRAGEGSVVAALRSLAESGAADLVTVPGTPGRMWVRTTTVAPVRFAPGLPRQIGTRFGPHPPDLMAPPERPADRFEPDDDEPAGDVGGG